jgi:RHS repeat-associated protein
VTTAIAYDGWKPMVERDLSGNVKAVNIYGAGSDEILWRSVTGVGDYRYHHDARGNAMFVLDGLGNLTEKYSYDAFGKPTILSANNTQLSTSAIGNRFMFQGREWIQELGIYDYRHRMYQPELGRFLQTDPSGFDAGDMNLFRYCGDDPVDGSDPTGLVNTNAGTTLEQRMRLFYGASDTGGGLYDLNIENSRTVSFAQTSRVEESQAKSMHDRAVEMLAREVSRGHPTQTGVVTDGPPYEVGPVNEVRQLIDPQHPSRGWKDVTLEKLTWRGPANQKIIIPHYHDRGGRYGRPTEKHDFEQLKQGPVYFTNPDLASQHKYEVLRLGVRPEVRLDPRIVLPAG